MTDDRLVLGVFSTEENAEDAIDELKALGYDPKDLSIVMRDRERAERVASNTGSNIVEGAASGAAAGTVIGGLAGLLLGIGAIAIPGVGPILIGGPLAAALGFSGAAASTVSGAVTGALAGGLLGALIGLGVPEEDARFYEDRIKEGGILLAVPTRRGREDEIADALDAFGADQVRTIDFDRSYRDDRSRLHKHL